MPRLKLHDVNEKGSSSVTPINADIFYRVGTEYAPPTTVSGSVAAIPIAKIATYFCFLLDKPHLQFLFESMWRALRWADLLRAASLRFPMAFGTIHCWNAHLLLKYDLPPHKDTPQIVELWFPAICDQI